MKTTHRQAGRAKAALRNELFSPGTDLHPQEVARRRKRQAARDSGATLDAANAWQQIWQPLTSEPTPVHRPGADNYLHYPSRIGDVRVPYHAAPTTEASQPAEAAPCLTPR